MLGRRGLFDMTLSMMGRRGMLLQSALRRSCAAASGSGGEIKAVRKRNPSELSGVSAASSLSQQSAFASVQYQSTLRAPGIFPYRILGFENQVVEVELCENSSTIGPVIC